MATKHMKRQKRQKKNAKWQDKGDNGRIGCKVEGHRENNQIAEEQLRKQKWFRSSERKEQKKNVTDVILHRSFRLKAVQSSLQRTISTLYHSF
jgi:hypothetical protein